MLRLFSDKENALLKELVEYKLTGDMRNLQVALLLRTKLSFFALKWDIEPTPNISIYSIDNDNRDEALQKYFEIADFIYFIQELVHIGFIKLLTIPSKNEIKQRMLFDRERYEFNADKNQFIGIGLDRENGILSILRDFDLQVFEKKEDYEGADPLTLQTVPNSLAYDLDEIVYKIIYPMPVLEEYVSNGFRTLEDKRYEENSSIALKSISIANRTLIISAVAFIASAIGCYFSYRGVKQSAEPTVISQNQINHLDSIIQTHSLSEPIKIKSNDTIMVLPVQASKNKK